MTKAANLASLGSNASTTGILPIAGGGTAGTNGAIGFKNRIINGGMTIDQRNAGASVTTASNPYTLDRWQAQAGATSRFTVQQNAGSVTPPAGFSKYLGCTSTGAYTVGASEIFKMCQSIEGYNIADLNWGTSNAAAVTLSFWVRSSLTGLFGGALIGGNLFYPFSYTINAANTWEQKTITVSGPTTGSWDSTNGSGIQVNFGLGVGSTYSGTAGSWSSTNYQSVTGATSVVGTNGATWYLTGVQLEVGTTATNFDFRSYGTELQLCQRYFQTYGNLSYSAIGTGTIASSGNIVKMSFIYPVVMRAAPSATFANLIATDRTAYDTNLTAIQQFIPSINGAYVGWNLSSTTGSQGWSTAITAANGTTGYLNFSAEL